MSSVCEDSHALCPRLLDYMCIVGARYPNSNSIAQTPELLRRYPTIDHIDFPLPPDVVFFCQPEGCISVGQKRVPLRDSSSFVFTLTDKESGVVRYGICVNFFRPFDRKYVAEAKQRNFAANGCDSNRIRNRNCNLNQSSDSISQESTDSENITADGEPNGISGSRSRVRKWKQRNNTLTSLCLISHHPFFSTFRQCVFILRKLIHACNQRSCSRRVGGTKSVLRDSVWGVLSGCTVSPELSPVITHDVKEIESWILRLLSAPVPIPGRTRVEIEVLPPSIQSPIVFALPNETRFSLCDFPLHLPLELLGVDTCMKVLQCILLEHKVVLQSRDYNALSMSVLAFVKMIYPLEYMFPVIPLLPTCMNHAEQLLLAPTPFIIGVPATFFLYKQSFRLPDDVWIIDLDSNKITVPLGAEELPKIVEPEASSLRNHLKGALASMSMPPPIENMDNIDLSRFRPGVEPMSNGTSSASNGGDGKDAVNPFVFGNDVDSIDVATRVAMVRFFNSPNILANHYEHTRTLRLFPRPVVAFQLNSFLKSRPTHSAFTAKLARTQAVEFFCEWSLSPTNMTFQRVHTNIFDPGVIGDKAKWFAHQLAPIYFTVCHEGSSLAAAVSVPEERTEDEDSDANVTDESGDEQLMDEATSLKSSSSYSSLSEFVSDMRSADINGETPGSGKLAENGGGGGGMGVAAAAAAEVLVDSSVFKPPTTLLYPRDPIEGCSEINCDPVQPSSDLLTSPRDSEAESVNSDSEDDASGLDSGIGAAGTDKTESSGEREFKNPMYDTNIARPPQISAPKRQGSQLEGADVAPARQTSDSFSSGSSSRCAEPPPGRRQESGNVGRSQSVNVKSGSASRSHRSDSGLAVFERGDRTAFVEKAASSLSRHSTRRRLQQAKNHLAERGGTAAFSESQTLLTEVVTSAAEGVTQGFFTVKKLRKLLENESLRVYLVSKLAAATAHASDAVATNYLEDQEVNKKVFAAVSQLLKACISGLEESIKASNFNGMASVFMLLEVAYTHVLIRPTAATGHSAADHSSREQLSQLKKVEGVLDSASKGLNHGLSFLLTAGGGGGDSHSTGGGAAGAFLGAVASTNGNAAPPNSPTAPKTNPPTNLRPVENTSAFSRHENPTPKPPLQHHYPKSVEEGRQQQQPTITVDAPNRGASEGGGGGGLMWEVDARRRQMEAQLSLDSTASDCSSTFSAGPVVNSLGGGAPGISESDLSLSSGGDTPTAAAAVGGGGYSQFRRISHHSIRSNLSDSECSGEVISSFGSAGGGVRQTPPPRMALPPQVRTVKSVFCQGYRYHNGTLIKLNNMPPPEANPRKYVFETLIEAGQRSLLWDNLQFWEDCFLDSVAAEREATVGMDAAGGGAADMLRRFSVLSPEEKKRLEAEEDRLLATTLHNMIAFMLAMRVQPQAIKKKARRMLGRCHIGLHASKEVNDLLDRLHYLSGNDVDLRPPVSRQARRQSFVVHCGDDNSGDVLFLEVCEDSVTLRSGNGVVFERMLYDKLINMSYSPKTRVLCLWKRQGTETVLSKYYTKKCRELYFAIKESMERAAAAAAASASGPKSTAPGGDLGGEFQVEDPVSGDLGTLQVTLDGIMFIFPNCKYFIELKDIKKCTTKKGVFILHEYVAARREIVVRKYKSQSANEICYAVLCVFSMVAAAKPASSASSAAGGTQPTFPSNTAAAPNVASPTAVYKPNL